MFDRPKKQTPYDYVLARARFKAQELCVKCRNIGVVRVQVNEVGTLARCSCDEGSWQIWKLPVLTKEMKSLPLPFDQFCPNFKPNTEVRVTRFIKEKISWWVEKIRVAEEFWLSQGG